MRVGLNGLGQLGVFGGASARGLGDCVYNPIDETQTCSDPVVDPSCPRGGTFDTVNCVDANGVILGAPGAGGAGSGVAAPVNQNETYKTPSDDHYVTGCSAYDADGNCVTCGSGYKLNTWGGAYTSCDSIGGLPGVKKPTNQPSAFSSILASIFGPPKTVAYSSAAACTAAKGTWNGTSCSGASAPGTLNIGGAVVSTTTLIVAGVFLMLVMKGKR